MLQSLQAQSVHPQGREEIKFIQGDGEALSGKLAGSATNKGQGRLLLSHYIEIAFSKE